MRNYEGTLLLGKIRDPQTRDKIIAHNFFIIDRFLKGLSTAGIPQGQPPRAGAGGGGHTEPCCGNQVDEFEPVNDATEGILSFGRTTALETRDVTGHSLTRLEGFELNDRFVDTNGDIIVGGVTFSSSIKRTGNFSLRILPAGAAATYFVVPDFDVSGGGGTNFYAAASYRVWIYVATAPDADREILRGTGAGAAQRFTVTMNASRVLSLNGTLGTTVIPLAIWTELTIKYDSASTGSVSLQIDRDPEFTDVAPTANGTIRQFFLGKGAVAGTYDIYFDDVAIESAASVALLDYPLPGGVVALPMSGNGLVTSTWSAVGAATNWECLDEPHDGDTTYITVSNNGTRDHTFTMSTPAAVNPQVNGVQFMTRGRSVNGHNTTVNIRTAATDVATIGATTNLNSTGSIASTSYTDLGVCRQLSPFSLAQWTEDEIDTMVVGLTVTLGGGASHILRMTTLVVLVDVGEQLETDVARAIRVTAEDGHIIPAYLVTDGSAIDVESRARLVAGTDGTNAQILLTDSDGRLQVDVAASSGTSMEDEDTFVIGTSPVTAAGFLVDEVATDSAPEGSIAAARMTLDRKLLVRVVGATDSQRLGVDSAGNATVSLAADTLGLTLVDDAAFTIGGSRVNAGGFVADETSPDSVDEGDVGAARMTLDRMQIVTPRPSATGEGLSYFKTIDLDESEEEVKDTAGKVYAYFLTNLSSSFLFVKFYDADADDVTVGTTAPNITLALPPYSAANEHFSLGIPFTNAITIACTTGVADNDAGAPGANELVATIWYK